jgi:cell shape-determining protein MreD
MRTFFLYFFLILGAYLCQTVLYPIFVISELRVDLFLVLLLHFSFSIERSKALVMALFLGLLMDVGLPLQGWVYPLIYLGLALLASMLWQNLNLHSRRYQALFLGLCTILESVGIRTILLLQDAGFAETSHFLLVVTARTITTALVGPLLLAGLERLDQWLLHLGVFRESQEA